MSNVLLSPDFTVLLFPAGLLICYLIAWLLVGRDPQIKNVVPQYGPPPGVSPGVARYIITGGSDGTTLASVLASMAVSGVISIEPAQKCYQLQLLNPKIAVWPEEAAVAKTLFHTELTAHAYTDGQTPIIGSPSLTPEEAQRHGHAVADDMAELSLNAAASPSPARTQAVVDPALASDITNHIGAIQNTFSKNLQGVYFRQNFIYSGIGTLMTFIWGLATAASIQAQSSIFITFWLLMFTSIAGLAIGGVTASRPTRPTLAQRTGRYILPLMFFGAPGAMIYFFALPHNHTFVIALLLAVFLNSAFFFLMRAPTVQGRAALQQLAGFREFLLRVEQDQLDRLNTPATRAELMNKFLPYAIALGVKEGWGDTMAAALSNAIVER